MDNRMIGTQSITFVMKEKGMTQKELANAVKYQ